MAFYFETNDQNKIANQGIKWHLQTYINYYQNNWVDLLPMTEFAINANSSAITKILPFQTTCKYILKMSFDPVDLLEKSTCKKLTNSKAWLIITDMEEVWKFMRKTIA